MFVLKNVTFGKPDGCCVLYVIYVALLLLSCNELCSVSYKWGSAAYQRGWGVGDSIPPPSRNSEVLTKLSRIPSSVEKHLYQPNKNTGFTHLQIERNPWLEGHRLQIPIFSVLNWICWTIPPPNKIPGYATGGGVVWRKLSVHLPNFLFF
jgi:hypothetical protein